MTTAAANQKQKTTRKRRATPANSAEAAIKAALAAASPLPAPPKCIDLPESAMPFWGAIIRSRARAEWSETDLILAAQLARVQQEMEEHTVLIRAEGSVIENARGTMVMNPRQSILERMAARQLSIFRSLQLGGVARGTRKDDLQRTRQAERDAREIQGGVADEVGDDDLLK